MFGRYEAPALTRQCLGTRTRRQPPCLARHVVFEEVQAANKPKTEERCSQNPPLLSLRQGHASQHPRAGKRTAAAVCRTCSNSCAQGHFMDQRYFGFDAPISIGPPEGAS